MAHLAKLRNLRFLNLGGTGVSSAGFVHLKQLVNLSSLFLDDMPQLTDDALDHIKDLPKLKSLQLGSTGITDAGLEKLVGVSRWRCWTLATLRSPTRVWPISQDSRTCGCSCCSEQM